MNKRTEVFNLLDLDKPEVIGIVITKRFGKVNVCPVNWQVMSSSYEKPPVICIGLSNESYTLESILQTKEFTFAYPSKEQLKDTLYCGTVSGRNVDKIKNTMFRFKKSKYISTPLLAGSVLSFECTRHKTVKIGNFTIVIGKIVTFYTSNQTSLDKVYSLGGFDYGIIEKIRRLQRGRV